MIKEFFTNLFDALFGRGEKHHPKILELLHEGPKTFHEIVERFPADEHKRVVAILDFMTHHHLDWVSRHFREPWDDLGRPQDHREYRLTSRGHHALQKARKKKGG